MDEVIVFVFRVLGFLRRKQGFNSSTRINSAVGFSVLTDLLWLLQEATRTEFRIFFLFVFAFFFFWARGMREHFLQFPTLGEGGFSLFLGLVRLFCGTPPLRGFFWKHCFFFRAVCLGFFFLVGALFYSGFGQPQCITFCLPGVSCSERVLIRLN